MICGAAMIPVVAARPARTIRRDKGGGDVGAVMVLSRRSNEGNGVGHTTHSVNIMRVSRDSLPIIGLWKSLESVTRNSYA
jgi:hypothetical protein